MRQGRNSFCNETVLSGIVMVVCCKRHYQSELLLILLIRVSAVVIIYLQNTHLFPYACYVRYSKIKKKMFDCFRNLAT